MNALRRRLSLLAAVALSFSEASAAAAEARLVKVHDAQGDHTYALDKEIGHGWWSAAYSAHDAQTNDRAVIKVLHQARLDEGKQDSFDKENQLMAVMEQRHAAFPHTKGVGVTNDQKPTRALVMEAVQGEPVSNGGPKPAGRSVRIVERVLDSVAQLHQTGWVHTDIHGGNVLWNPKVGSPSTRVIDLGNAQKITPQKGTWVDVQAAGKLLVKLSSGLNHDQPGAFAALDRDLKVITQPGRRPFRVSLGQVARAAIAGTYRTPQDFKNALFAFQRD